MTQRGLLLLEHLSYILECSLLDAVGEMKSELSNLCNDIMNATDADVPLRHTVVSELEQALDLYLSWDYKEADSQLSRASRLWWDAVKAGLAQT